MTRLARTAAAVSAAMVLVVLVPLVSLGGQEPGDTQPTSPRVSVPRETVATTADVVTRLAGADRHATSVAIARATHGDRTGSERPRAAVLARGDAFADALAGGPLAHHLDAPLLLTRPDTLPDVTREALGDLLAAGATVHVLGGPTAVTDDVVATLRRDGWAVERHAGDTRYGTAAAIADVLPRAELAYLASGVEPADALAAAPVAARRGAPVLLTDPSRLPAETAAALAEVDRVVLVGGHAAVAEAVAEGLRTTHRLARVAGEDRFATAVAVANHAPGDPAGVSIASGRSWPDALTGAAHAAATASVLLLAETDRLTWPTADAVTRLQGLPTHVYGGEVAVAPEVEEDIHLARDSHPDAPVPTGLDPGRRVPAGTDLRLQFSRHLASSDVVVTPPADTAPARDGATLVAPLPGTDRGELRVEVRGGVSDADGRTRRFRETVTVVEAAGAHVVSPEGFRVAPGTGPVIGTGGPLVRWTAEVEPATGRRLDQVLPVVATALGDPDHGWTARGEYRLQRIDDPTAADVRVVLATPQTVDAFCARHGLDTAGIFSCWDGQRAMLNLTRWDHGATDFADLATYRTYVVNHEVGHGLGRGHVDCPAPGVPAPIMMQQTKSVGECRPNGWPYP